MLYIVTGGSGSGKSEYAEQTAVQCWKRGNGGTLWYLATIADFGMMKAENGWSAIGGCARQKGLRRLSGIRS